MTTRQLRLLGTGLAAGGIAFTAIQMVVGYQMHIFQVPGGEVTSFYDRAGDALRSGGDVYFGAPGSESFYYSPPWAVFFATFSWLPGWGEQVVMWIIDALCLRYLAGSWRRVGYLGWMPLMSFELASGQINLVVAASIVAATRGDSHLTVPGTLAKLSPVLAVRQPRPFLLGLGLAVLITLPWLGLWPTWFFHVAGAAGSHVGPQIPVPLPLRFAIAAAFLLVGTRGVPWATALGAVLAIPAFYYASLVVLVAPIVVFIDSRARLAEAPAPDARVDAAAPLWARLRSLRVPGRVSLPPVRAAARPTRED